MVYQSHLDAVAIWPNNLGGAFNLRFICDALQRPRPRSLTFFFAASLALVIPGRGWRPDGIVGRKTCAVVGFDFRSGLRID